MVPSTTTVMRQVMVFRSSCSRRSRSTMRCGPVFATGSTNRARGRSRRTSAMIAGTA
ncbi:hypothetical protein ACFQV2_20905 [Actinokineospora soli]|uniref:Uncharacterized protein n=1 Tax=Actinokineospora soli TaxID=1048753 RepID=A0ABW2TRH8_9PSEU